MRKLNNTKSYSLPDSRVQYDVPLIRGERPVAGHAGAGGLQRHSIGDTYPYLIVYKGYGGPNGSVLVKHALTNDILGVWNYASNIDFEPARDAAYKAARILAQKEKEYAATTIATAAGEVAND